MKTNVITELLTGKIPNRRSSVMTAARAVKWPVALAMGLILGAARVNGWLPIVIFAVYYLTVPVLVLERRCSIDLANFGGRVEVIKDFAASTVAVFVFAWVTAYTLAMGSPAYMAGETVADAVKAAADEAAELLATVADEVIDN